jgi:hypothetical protein
MFNGDVNGLFTRCPAPPNSATPSTSLSTHTRKPPFHSSGLKPKSIIHTPNSVRLIYPSKE